MIMAPSDGRYFVWAQHAMAWSVPRLIPQLILDHEQFEYVVEHNKEWTIIKKQVLEPDEYHLTIDELILKYPSSK